MRHPAAWIAAAGLALSASAWAEATGPLSSTFTDWLLHPAIAYDRTPAQDPVARLSKAIADGTVQLHADAGSGYLRSVLEALGVPVESQIAVFQPDSMQRVRIRHDNPRVLYFNESVAVGWVRGGFIELAAQDPRQGVIFYTFGQDAASGPQFRRSDGCLTCHYSYATAGVPGMLARSTGQFAMDHTVPIAERWGGWYVTGQHGATRHLGNAALDRLEQNPSGETQNWPSFTPAFDTTGYLSVHSDIVALLVFEHQMHMMNLLSRIGWEARVADYQRTASRSLVDRSIAAMQDAPIPLVEAAKEVVDYMLFVDEAPILEKITGSSGFADWFATQGPRDRNGRSLREFDLARRTLRYPCSYMIYSPLFDAMPTSAREAIYQRLWSVLSGVEQSDRYGRLTRADRQAVVEILRDTKADLPAYFTAVTQ